MLRTGLSVLYVTAGFINMTFAIRNPEIYRAWADSALLPFYREFMLTVPTNLLIVALLAVASFEVIIGAMLLTSGVYVKTAVIGAMAFHIAILPWGLWSLPNILFLFPLYYLLRQAFPSSIRGSIN